MGYRTVVDPQELDQLPLPFSTLSWPTFFIVL